MFIYIYIIIVPYVFLKLCQYQSDVSLWFNKVIHTYIHDTWIKYPNNIALKNNYKEYSSKLK